MGRYSNVIVIFMHISTFILSHELGFANGLLESGITPRQGKKSDQAHPPIHPIKAAPNLAGNEKRVYEFIVRHFLACCSKDAKGMETIVEIIVHGEQVNVSF